MISERKRSGSYHLRKLVQRTVERSIVDLNFHRTLRRIRSEELKRIARDRSHRT